MMSVGASWLTPADPRLWSRRIQFVERTLLLFALAAIVTAHGMRRFEMLLSGEVGWLSQATLAALSGGLALRYFWSRSRAEFLRERRAILIISCVWLFGLLIVWSGGLPAVVRDRLPAGRLSAGFAWSEGMLLLRVAAELVFLARRIAATGLNPALIFVMSFATAVAAGTLLLLLPAAREPLPGVSGEQGAPFLVAFFTATSACCVTGLTVVETGSYWSRSGQIVILMLIQAGGLGIMSFGAFFALLSSGGLRIREGAFFGSVLEAGSFRMVKRTIAAILVFTILAEVLGAVLLSGLWPELPWSERLFQSLFHSISAFCNAGFALLPQSFEGLGDRWQVWGVTGALIVVGGLGFSTLQNSALVAADSLWRAVWKPRRRASARRPRLTLTSRLVLTTTAILLLTGTLGFLLLEAHGQLAAHPPPAKLAHAWFQSVTCRTAGFNTIDVTRIHPATKLLAVILMFIGASPGGTGGGIRTVSYAVAHLAILACLRGRDRVEAWGRTIPDEIVKRGGAILALAIIAVLNATFLIVVIEDRPEAFLDHLFEATSAFATVGLSTATTARLQPASQMVLIVTMFIGRVGPLTLLLALAGNLSRPDFDYPQERVMLG